MLAVWQWNTRPPLLRHLLGRLAGVQARYRSAGLLEEVSPDKPSIMLAEWQPDTSGDAAMQPVALDNIQEEAVGAAEAADEDYESSVDGLDDFEDILVCSTYIMIL